MQQRITLSKNLLVALAASKNKHSNRQFVSTVGGRKESEIMDKMVNQLRSISLPKPQLSFERA